MHGVNSNQDINLSAHRLLLLSVNRPSMEYGGEVWEDNKGQVAALVSIILGGAKRIRLKLVMKQLEVVWAIEGSKG